MVVTVDTGRESYDVAFGRFEETFDVDAAFGGAEKCLVVTDENVAEALGGRITEALFRRKTEIITCVLRPGEHNKNMLSLEKIIDYLGKNEFKRSDVLISFGGGVVSDLAGLAAGLYMRGIRYYSVPTTLLAMVDASVGGKTGIDTGIGKNTIGMFYQPGGVIVDKSFLETLPEEKMKEGFAEAIKCGLIAGGELYEDIKNKSDVGKIIYGAVKLKAEIVGRDELDRGERHLLNLGHTLGHAVERASDYKIAHGFAVAIGLSAIYPESDGILSAYGLPTRKYLKENGDLFEKALDLIGNDKKSVSNNEIDVVLVNKPGDCIIKRMKADDFGRIIRDNV